LTIIQIFYIPKKKAGYRTVHSVKSESFSSVLKVLDMNLLSWQKPHSAVHGFIPRRNIKTNAEQHLGKKFVLSVDIKDFFESITIEMVNEVFLELGFNSLVSDYLSKIVTVNGRLAQGFNTSPVISNFVVNKMDIELTSLGGTNTTYTRYADDLYFSSDEELPTVEDIEQIIQKYKFELNPDKTRLMKRGSKQYVTGLTVFDRVMPRISKKVKRNLRLEIYYIHKFGYRHHVLNKLGISYQEYKQSREIRKAVSTEIIKCENRILGWLRFILSVEKTTAEKFFTKLRTKRGFFQI
jgi:RNA-directed DNA polymerase